MGLVQRVKVMLGLADEYDEYEEDFEGEDYEDEDYEPAPRLASPYGSESSSVRRVNREPDLVRARDAAPLRAVPSPSENQAAASAAAQIKIFAVEPRSFSEAQNIGDKFRSGQTVILNLTATDAELSRRLLDFASGLTYGLDGGIQKVSEKVFMLTPHNVDMTAAGERVRSRASSLFGE
jgi:cell division inhibitor SepF